MVSAQTLKHFAVTTIETYAGKVLTAMNIALGFPIIGQRTRFKKLVAAAAGASTVSAVRRKRQGVRRQHLLKVAARLLASQPKHRSQTELDNVNK